MKQSPLNAASGPLGRSDVPSCKWHKQKSAKSFLCLKLKEFSKSHAVRRTMWPEWVTAVYTERLATSLSPTCKRYVWCARRAWNGVSRACFTPKLNLNSIYLESHLVLNSLFAQRALLTQNSLVARTMCSDAECLQNLLSVFSLGSNHHQFSIDPTFLILYSILA